MQNLTRVQHGGRENSREDRITVLSQENQPGFERDFPSQRPYLGNEENVNDYESLDRTNNTNNVMPQTRNVTNVQPTGS